MPDTTSIRKCFCEHKYQDKRYGKHKRVFNYSIKGWRCTVCGKDEIVTSRTKT